MTKILIIEDEPRAANQLQKMIHECAFEFELLDVLDSVESTVEWLEKNDTPALIFMDIQLADGLSFEIFNSTIVKSPIIFTTAFDQYAIQAFKVNSIDYLLKPIQKEDLQFALDQFKKTNLSHSIDLKKIQKIMHDMQVQQKREGILVKEGKGFVQIKINDIQFFYSEDGITFGVTENKRYIIDESMDQLFDSLNPDQFYRINRGKIVSKSAVQKIQPYFNHRVKLDISNSRDQDFIVSRKKTTTFKEWMNQ